MTKVFVDRPAQAGQFLKKELKKRKISQEHFAECIGYDVRTVRRWIHNGINQVDVLFMIVSILELNSIGDIFSSGNDVPCVLLCENTVALHDAIFS